VLDAARKEAQTLAGRAIIPVSDKAYAVFAAIPDAPPQPNGRLCKSLQNFARRMLKSARTHQASGPGRVS